MTIHTGLRADPELAALRAVSARLGADPLQVQGPGGNTSVKRDGAMWVKASGTWLADAATAEIFVPVDAAAMRAAMTADPAAAERGVFRTARGERKHRARGKPHQQFAPPHGDARQRLDVDFGVGFQPGLFHLQSPLSKR